MNAERVIAQEGTDETSDRTAEPADGGSEGGSPPDDVTGPHFGRDEQGRFDHRYWRCEVCGFESIDPRLRWGCFRCGDRDADAPEPRTRRSADAD